MSTLFRRKPGGPWCARYTKHDGSRGQKSTGTRSKSDAARILASWETRENDIRQGVAPGPSARMHDLFEEYIEFLGNNGAKHIATTRQRVERILDACCVVHPGDVDRVRIENAVRVFIKLNEVEPRPISKRSQSHYLTAIKGFTLWLTQLRHVYARDPLQGVKKPNFEVARVLVRRFLLPDEWPWLASTAHSLLYETAIQTGLRAGELESVRPHHIKDDHILLPAKFCKNKKQARQFIGEKLQARLIAGGVPFAMPSVEKTAGMLRGDLELARTRWLASKPGNPASHFLQPTNASGEQLDFHALRHTCGAWLAIKGVNPKVIQTVMRHSTITLTLDTYGHLMPGAENDAAEQLTGMLLV